MTHEILRNSNGLGYLHQHNCLWVQTQFTNNSTESWDGNTPPVRMRQPSTLFWWECEINLSSRIPQLLAQRAMLTKPRPLLTSLSSPWQFSYRARVSCLGCDSRHVHSTALRVCEEPQVLESGKDTLQMG